MTAWPPGLGIAAVLKHETFLDHGLLERRVSALPVVSVGNLTLGGTNKTPFVEMLVQEVAARGIRVGIVSRGYKGGATAPEIVGRSAPGSFAGDEPMLLHHRLPDVPIAVANDRNEGITLLGAEENVELAVADDAFQHRRLRRDVDIVLVDALCPWGNGRLFPAGLLREGAEALRRAHLVVITKADQVSSDRLEYLEREIENLVEPGRLFRSRLAVSRWDRWDGTWEPGGPDTMSGKSAVAFSAIGNPASFRRSLEQQGVRSNADIASGYHRFTKRPREACEKARFWFHTLVCSERTSTCSMWVLRWLYCPEMRTGSSANRRVWKTLGFLRPASAPNSMGRRHRVILGRSFVKPSDGDLAFSLVGSGKPYADARFEVVSPVAETPSGGIVKYNILDFLRDLRFGLIGIIREQILGWEDLRNRQGPVFCVGDVYLALQALWGLGGAPALVATAKTAYIAGHLGIERFVLKHRVAQVWARDEETAAELSLSGVKARFAGNPIMDLASPSEAATLEWPGSGGRKILLLPGSRSRAYGEFPLLLDAASRIEKRLACRFPRHPRPRSTAAGASCTVAVGKAFPEAPPVALRPLKFSLRGALPAPAGRPTRDRSSAGRRTSFARDSGSRWSPSWRKASSSRKGSSRTRSGWYRKTPGPWRTRPARYWKTRLYGATCPKRG